MELNSILQTWIPGAHRPYCSFTLFPQSVHVQLFQLVGPDICSLKLILMIYSRSVKVSALIYAINVAAINALKYFNATLFTSGVRCPLTRNRRVPTLLKSTRTCHTSCSSLWHSNKHPVFFTPLPPSPLTHRPTSQWEPVIPHSPTPLV